MASVKKEKIRWTDTAGQQRETERWVARYRDETGRQRKKNFSRKVDGQRWLDETTASVLTGRYVDPAAGKITFSQFYEIWNQRQIWLSTSRVSADNAVKQCTFKDVPLKNIRKSHVEAWVKHMTATLAPSTIKTRFSIVHSVLRAAVSEKVIPEDPAERVTLPAKRRGALTMELPAAEEVGTLINKADQEQRVSTRVGFRAYVALCAFAGLRKGEALGVQVADIDFLRRSLKVSRQVQRATPDDVESGKNIFQATGSVQVIVRPPKYGSERMVYLPDELIEILSEHIAQHTPDGETQRWLFADSDGYPWHDSSVDWRWRGTRDAAGLRTKLHDLRHFFASGLIAAGCDVVTVQRAMGHASATTTLNTYSHIWPTAEDKTRQAAAGLVQQALTGPGTGRTPGAEASNVAFTHQLSKHASGE